MQCNHFSSSSDKSDVDFEAPSLCTCGRVRAHARTCPLNPTNIGKCSDLS